MPIFLAALVQFAEGLVMGAAVYSSGRDKFFLK